jgi:hypothetical protein
MISAQKLISTTILALTIGVCSTQISRADFLDDLFGGDDGPAQSAKPARRNSGSFGVQTLRERRSHRRDSGAASQNTKVSGTEDADKDEDDKEKFKKLALCVPHEQKEQVSKDHNALYFDKTLKHGDSVMTPNGLHVFKGQTSCPHVAEEFVPVARHNSKKHNSALLAIDAASKQPRRQ